MKYVWTQRSQSSTKFTENSFYFFFVDSVLLILLAGENQKVRLHGLWYFIATQVQTLTPIAYSLFDLFAIFYYIRNRKIK
jgi:hypothetical protein